LKTNCCLFKRCHDNLSNVNLPIDIWPNVSIHWHALALLLQVGKEFKELWLKHQSATLKHGYVPVGYHDISAKCHSAFWHLAKCCDIIWKQCQKEFKTLATNMREEAKKVINEIEIKKQDEMSKIWLEWVKNELDMI
jgi:hypothetical protein